MANKLANEPANQSSMQPASQRSCGSCTECCRTIAVAELYKPAGAPCVNCSAGIGCKVYAQRPQSCRDFVCGWLQAPYMGPDLRPDKCHVVFLQPDRDTILANCDADRPDAWRAPHVLAMLHLLAKNFADRIVLVRVESRLWRVLEDSIVPITS